MIVLYVLLASLAAIVIGSSVIDAVLNARERRYRRYRDARLRAVLAMMAESPRGAIFSFRDPRLKLAVASVETPFFAWRGPFPKLTPFEETMVDLSRTCWIGRDARSDGIGNDEFRDPAFRFVLTDLGRRRFEADTAAHARPAA